MTSSHSSRPSRSPAVRGWINIAISFVSLAVAIFALLDARESANQARQAEAHASTVVAANELRRDLLSASYRMETARRNQDSDEYRFEWLQMVDRVEGHLAEMSGGKQFEDYGGQLVVNTLTALRNNCRRAVGASAICDFDGRPLSACLLKQEALDPASAIAACVDGSR